MRRLLLFVILPAAVVAALASRSRTAEAPATTEGAAAAPGPTPSGSDPLGLKATLEAIRQRFREAVQAAKEARDKREAELLSELNQRRKGQR